MPRDLPDCADIEIIEPTQNESRDGANGIVIPREVRINGKPVLMPKDHPPKFHEIEIGSGSPVLVTLTVFARSVVIRHEHEPYDDDTREKRWSVWDLTDSTMVATLSARENPFESVPCTDYLAGQLLKADDPGTYMLTEDDGPARVNYSLGSYTVENTPDGKQMKLVWAPM